MAVARHALLIRDKSAEHEGQQNHIENARSG